MSPEQMKEKAMDLFKKRFHCSQAVCAAGQEKVGQINEEVIKSLGSYGGGVASSGRVCGALLGGVALVSSLYSRGNLAEKEDPRMWLLSRKLVKKFEEITKEYGGVNCADIARVNWFDNAQVKEFYSNPESRRNICIKIVGETAYALGQLLEEDEKQAKQS